MEPYDLDLFPDTSPKNSLQCNKCHIIFYDHKKHTRHMKRNHPEEYEQFLLRTSFFVCYVCSHHFSSSVELIAHQKTHTDKKPYKCVICDIAFVRLSQLTNHKKIHFSMDGYPCLDCGTMFKTLCMLTTHRRKHTGEMPFICKPCGKRFAMTKHLEEHSRCCSKGGGGKSSAKANQKVVKKKYYGVKKIYPCSLCNLTYKSSYTMLKHIQIRHASLLSAASKAPPGGHPMALPVTQDTLRRLLTKGPVNKIDAQMDPKQISALIDFLACMQKGNCVVKQEQVTPHAPPLEVQEISQETESVNLSLSPPQQDLYGEPSDNEPTSENQPQSERDNWSFGRGTVHLNESKGSCSTADVIGTGRLTGKATDETTEKTLTLQTVSCSIYQEASVNMDVKKVIIKREIKHEEESDHSGVVILEEVLSSAPQLTADEEVYLKTEMSGTKKVFKPIAVNGVQDIKIEQVISLAEPMWEDRQRTSTRGSPVCTN
ncbi:zinc finger protein 440-like isoform X2 [Notolabrus celidotus]|uniref:zinc finger protein 440-like isoform X2 n=1 Tax=Notolabrus celidotus TaxID=1203425 RepID=UPI001490021E|nr:zinc finger protein 440-like isoform X2 [Notolabrus celidotus]